MTDTSSEQDSAQTNEDKKFTPTIHSGSFRDLLQEHLGKLFLIANPESFEETGLGGNTIQAGWYRAKLVGLGDDYLIVISEFSHGTGKHAQKEPVKQFIPIGHIKRISLMRSERLIHI